MQYTYTTQLSSAPLPPTANVMKPRNGPSYFTIKLILNKFVQEKKAANPTEKDGGQQEGLLSTNFLKNHSGLKSHT